MNSNNKDTYNNSESSTTSEVSDAQESHVEISSDLTKQTLTRKMQDIEIQRKEELTEERGTQLGMHYINLLGFPIGPETLAVIPEKFARQYRVICFFKDEAQIRIAALEPQDSGIQKIVSDFQKTFPLSHIEVYIFSEHSFEKAVELYKALPKFKPISKELALDQATLERFQKEITNFDIFQKRLQTGTVSEKLALIIAAAIRAESSDIHIQSEANEGSIRFRIDGVLQIVGTLPKAVVTKLVNRIKSIAGLKINITDVPQDGRVTVELGNEKLDVRVSSLPSAYGESIVMRLLLANIVHLSFQDLGLRGKAFDDLKREIGRPNGMILTTGPTGSGKTTTMYAMLRQLNKPEVKIVTLEDPIEYKLPGITQSQVSYSKNYTFAKGLRAILRQDPDIVMVGEIRDAETAEISVQAALTGHLVLSTIHTNDASGAVPRFLSMGVRPFLLAPALNTIVGQRLVRKICPHCKVPDDTLSEATLETVRSIIADIPESSQTRVDLSNMKFYHGKGCAQCHNGLRGRIGIFEVLIMNENIERVLLSEEVSEYRMKDLAHEYGMITMVQDGLIKALNGITTVAEVFRVVQ